MKYYSFPALEANCLVILNNLCLKNKTSFWTILSISLYTSAPLESLFFSHHFNQFLIHFFLLCLDKSLTVCIYSTIVNWIVQLKKTVICTQQITYYIYKLNPQSVYYIKKCPTLNTGYFTSVVFLVFWKQCLLILEYSENQGIGMRQGIVF